MHDHTRLADNMTFGSILAFVGSWLIEATPILQALALIASIIAAACSVYYHIKRGR